MAFHPCCHFLAPDFWLRYESAKQGGVFYFWGHSYEMITEAMWIGFGDMIGQISADPESRWAYVSDLFDDSMYTNGDAACPAPHVARTVILKQPTRS